MFESGRVEERELQRVSYKCLTHLTSNIDNRETREPVLGLPAANPLVDHGVHGCQGVGNPVGTGRTELFSARPHWQADMPGATSIQELTLLRLLCSKLFLTGNLLPVHSEPNMGSSGSKLKKLWMN